MEERELEKALKSIEEVKAMLSQKKTYFVGLWQFFAFLSVCVLAAYAVMQFLVNTNNLSYSPILWIVFAALLVMYPFISVWHLRKHGINVSISFKNLPAATTLFIIGVSTFVQSLPPRFSPFLPNESYMIWLISYAIMEFVTGYYFSTTGFIVASIITLIGIPIALAFGIHTQILIAGLFLGLPLLLSAVIEIRRKSENR
jgi:hypothetical protein